MKKLRVAVLMGGASSEHNVSLASGREVVSSLDPSKFEVFPIVISRDGKTWTLVNKDKLIDTTTFLKDENNEIVLLQERAINGISGIRSEGIDVVFIAMHGPNGEDGTIQGVLELAGLRYTGSGVLSSALGTDKILFRKILEADKLPYPKYQVHSLSDPMINVKPNFGDYPYIVKPYNQGSSVGVSIAKNIEQLKTSIDQAHKFSELVLVDEYIKGVELTCPIIGNDSPIALPIVEIVPKNDFFDYESKYLSDETQEIVPARVDAKITAEVQRLSIAVYKAIRARGFARVDFILDEKNTPYILEINTIPGLTAMSLFPKSAKAFGLSYPNLIEKIIGLAVEK